MPAAENGKVSYHMEFLNCKEKVENETWNEIWEDSSNYDTLKYVILKKTRKLASKAE